MNPVINTPDTGSTAANITANPIIIPVSNSTSDTMSESDGNNSALDILPTAAFQYHDIDKMLKDTFNYKESNGSMICDIIAMYLKGQKILYTEAKTLCEQ